MNDEINELDFDEAVRSDPRNVVIHVKNAINELEFALHKIERSESAIQIVDCLVHLQEWISQLNALKRGLEDIREGRISSLEDVKEKIKKRRAENREC